MPEYEQQYWTPEERETGVLKTDKRNELVERYERRLNDGMGLAERQVKGRMDDIPIQGVVVDHPDDKVIVNVPVYFSPSGFICGECDYFMGYESPKQGKVKAFCTNINCSQNLITKIITLPFSENCVVDPCKV